jgi:cyclopropane fatty-acyl-phospholipid synthase-like methyltransferase
VKSIEESVVTAMDGSDKELFPFLPYILQDVWEIGAEPAVIIGLVRKHATDYSGLRILDLGCGKGAISIKLAKEFNCSCFGIDAITEFIAEANSKAAEFDVAHRCRFEIGDIRESVKTLPRFDIIILGAIGPVLGDYYATLTTLSKCLTPDGMLIVDDGYIEDESQYIHPLIQKKETVLQQVAAAGMTVIDEVIIQKDTIKESDDYIFERLQKRCLELIAKHPDKKELFEDYIQRQTDENDILETKIVCATIVIRRNNHE